jgi:hypothetical protein
MHFHSDRSQEEDFPEDFPGDLIVAYQTFAGTK